MKTVKEYPFINYIETPLRRDTPVKINKILEARMRAFIRARTQRPNGQK